MHRANPLLTFDDKPIPDELVPLVQPFEAARINRVVEKIIRCLFYRHQGKILLTNVCVSIDVDPLTERELALVQEEPVGSIGQKPTDFLYWFELGIRDCESSWLLLFFRDKHFRVQTGMNTDSH